VNVSSVSCNGVSDVQPVKRVHRESSHNDTNCKCCFNDLVISYKILLADLAFLHIYSFINVIF